MKNLCLIILTVLLSFKWLIQAAIKIKNYKLILTLFFLFVSLNSYSQKEFKVGDIIKLKSSFIVDKDLEVLYKIDSFTIIKKDEKNEKEFIQTPNKLNILESGFLYKINFYDTNEVKIEPLKFKVFKQNRIKKRNEKYRFLENYKIDKSIRSILYNNNVYPIPKKEFDKIAEPFVLDSTDLFTIGLLTLPFKFRPQGEKSFTTNFNINSTLNYRLLKYSQTNLFVQLGAGIGSVSLNSTNAQGIENDESQNVEALTWMVGIMLQYKKIQAGIYSGVDYINNQKNYQWESNGKIWVGFGIGYELFKVNLGKSKQTKNN